jgi:hypothetical protein
VNLGQLYSKIAEARPAAYAAHDVRWLVSGGGSWKAKDPAGFRSGASMQFCLTDRKGIQSLFLAGGMLFE